MNGWESHGWTQERSNFLAEMALQRAGPPLRRRHILDQEVALCLILLVCVYVTLYILFPRMISFPLHHHKFT